MQYVDKSINGNLITFLYPFLVDVKITSESWLSALSLSGGQFPTMINNDKESEEYSFDQLYQIKKMYIHCNGLLGLNYPCIGHISAGAFVNSLTADSGNAMIKDDDYIMGVNLQGEESSNFRKNLNCQSVTVKKATFGLIAQPKVFEAFMNAFHSMTNSSSADVTKANYRLFALTLAAPQSSFYWNGQVKITIEV